jgi:hypothetical protein
LVLDWPRHWPQLMCTWSSCFLAVWFYLDPLSASYLPCGYIPRIIRDYAFFFFLPGCHCGMTWFSLLCVCAFFFSSYLWVIFGLSLLFSGLEFGVHWIGMAQVLRFAGSDILFSSTLVLGIWIEIFVLS